jgi:hypothetical protein
MLPWVAWHDKVADAVGPLARRRRVRSSTSAAAAPQQQQAADRFSELCGYSLPLGRSREMRMHVLAFPNGRAVARPFGDRARFSREKSEIQSPTGRRPWRQNLETLFSHLAVGFDRPRADRGPWRQNLETLFSTSRWVLTDRGRTEDVTSKS